MDPIWLPYGLRMDSVWILYGFHHGFRHGFRLGFHHGFCVLDSLTLRPAYGFGKESAWILYGFQVGAANRQQCFKTQQSYESLDYGKPWSELRDGEWYCNFRVNWATDGHILNA